MQQFLKYWSVALIGLVALSVHALGGSIAGVTNRQAELGPFGPEGPRMREQLWLVPGADPLRPLRATVFRPRDSGEIQHERPLVIINHGTDAETREAEGLPVFYWLSRWFVNRGYVVVLPQRRGVGATGGEFVEDFDSCLHPDHLGAGRAASDDIESVLEFMKGQPFVSKTSAVVVGVSSGGWASLALASRNPAGVSSIITFAAGRGAYAWGKAGAICGEEALYSAAGSLAATARVPTLWLYAQNDSFFPPRVAERLFQAWVSGGGYARFHLLEPVAHEGHDIATVPSGPAAWGPLLSRFLAEDVHSSTPRQSASYVSPQTKR